MFLLRQHEGRPQTSIGRRIFFINSGLALISMSVPEQFSNLGTVFVSLSHNKVQPTLLSAGGVALLEVDFEAWLLVVAMAQQAI